MSDNMAKSSGPIHTNIIYQVINMYQTGENLVCPKAARACPNPGRLDILRTNFFLDLKFSGMVPLIIFYNC